MCLQISIHYLSILFIQLIITFVTNHYICNKCNNEVNSYICTKLALLQIQLRRQGIYFLAVFAFEADDCGWLVG